MAQSCRESAQTSTKYIAASPKQAEEHHALLEAILSQQLNTIKKLLFFFALVASQNFFSTNDADFWIIRIIPINSSFDVFKSSLTSKASSKSRTLHCLQEKTELKKNLFSQAQCHRLIPAVSWVSSQSCSNIFKQRADLQDGLGKDTSPLSPISCNGLWGHSGPQACPLIYSSLGRLSSLSLRTLRSSKSALIRRMWLFHLGAVVQLALRALTRKLGSTDPTGDISP